MAGRIRKIAENAIIWLALGWTICYLYYLRQPIEDKEFRYFVHLPLALVRLLIFFGENFLDFFWVFLIAFSGLGLSFLILEKGFRLRLSPGFLLGVGLGLLGLLIFFLGALHLLYLNLLRALISVLAVPGFYFLVSRWRGRRAITASSALEMILISVFGIALLLVLIHPTTFYDTLSYHFSLPRQYLLRNSIAPFPSIAYSHFPQIAEMLYLAGLATAGQLPAQMINWLFWLAILLLAREIFSIFFSSAPKILCTILLLSLPIFSYLTHIITNDLPGAFFILAGVYLLNNEQISLVKRSFLFGLVAGLGCSVKLTLYLYLLFPQSFWLAYILLKTERKNFLRNALIAFLGFALICAGFWLRNIIAVGNPFYPALVNFFGGPLSPEQSEAIWNDAMGIHYSRGLVKELFQIPHEFQYAPLFRKGLTHPVPFFGTAFSAGLILLLLKKPNRRLIPIFLYCLIFYLVWVMSFRLTRFALGLWILLAILSAGGFALVRERGKWQKRAVALALALAVVVSLSLELLNGARETGWRMLLRKESGEQYLYRQSRAYWIQLGAYPVLNWLNHNSRAEDQVLLLGPTCFFYLERKAYVSSFIDWNPLLVLFNLNKSPEEVCRILSEERIQYLVFQPAELERLSRQYPANRLSPEGQKRMEEFFQSNCLGLVLKLDSPSVYLYRIVRN